jgi:hypothetical protein
MKGRVRDPGMKYFSTEDRNKQQKIVPVVPPLVELRSLKSWTRQNTTQDKTICTCIDLINQSNSSTRDEE